MEYEATALEAARRWAGETANVTVDPAGTRSYHRVFRAASGRGTAVVKVFMSAQRDEARREWKALTALAHTDISPVPLVLAEDALSPVVVMTVVEGRALRFGDLVPSQLEQVGRVLATIHGTPTHSTRPAHRQPPALLDRARDFLADLPPDGFSNATRAEAHRAATAWIGRCELDELVASLGAVLCRGDNNFGNYLWDGDRLVVVDFEDSGLGDARFEVAELVEHIANRDITEDRVADIGAACAIDVMGATCVEARRLYASFWFAILEHRERVGKPPREVTPEDQARRVLDMIG